MKTVRWVKPRDKDRTLHVETPLGIVNIMVGLHDPEGNRVDAISITPNNYAGEPKVRLDGYHNSRLIELKEGDPK